ncbi:MAG: GYD domain-containing protein [Gemmatimonadota bacterium]|nr:GYD domain-containing protein [Gemmatimonadota bacterium]
MPTFLWRASYTAEGAKGLVKDGGSKRRDVVQQMVTKAGGKLIAFYFAVGDDDVVGIAEFPDLATAVGLSIAINASGAVNFHTTMLLSPEEMDAATKMSIGYRAPGA